MTLSAAFLTHPIAHRCLHDIDQGRPENSWEAVDAAIGADLPVEIDLQLSRDGRAVVFHDDILDRLTTKTGLLRAYDGDELAAITLKGGSRTIPLFEQFCAYVGGRVPILVEMKDQTGILGPSDGALEQAVCDVLTRYDGMAAVMSFNPDMVANCARLAPQITRGLVTDPFEKKDWPNISAARRVQLANIQSYDALGASFVSHKHTDLHAPALAALKARGAKLLCWTITNKKQEIRARKIADNITFEGYRPG